MSHAWRHCVSRSIVLLLLFLNGVAVSAAERAVFYRGINLNGPAIEIDRQKWEGNDAEHFRSNGNSFETQSVPLKPTTDRNRAQMIRSSRWGRELEVELLDVPPGDYQVFLYVWEDNNSETFSVSVNDKLEVKAFASGAAGSWRRLGPWLTRPDSGTIRVSARGGDANFSGVEVWSGSGEVPSITALGFVDKPNDEQLAFFESRIRPLLIRHCYECHSQDAKEPGGNLLLDSRVAILKGGDNGLPIVAGDPESSLLVKAIRRNDADLQMPPEDKLSDAEIADLEAWIRMGAPDPRTDDTLAKAKAKNSIDWDKARDFWSLRPVTSPIAPKVKNEAWPKNDLDRFVLAKIEDAGLKPADDAPKATLIRRAYLDLIGLPPSPEDIEKFEADTSPDAFAKVVDHLLKSPQYGERWGRHWLDVVRYSDTAGDNSDFPIPQMVRYRNWVIDAFNRDLRYDQFAREQLAGDLLGGDLREEAEQRIIATGYIANARRFGSRLDDYPQHLTIEDTIDNLGRTFLATTVNCARCHNHKFDPITTEDYYGLYGIFHSTRYPWPGIELEQKQRDLVPLAAAGELAYAVSEKAKAEDVPVQLKGDPAKPGVMVRRHFLTVLGGATLSDEDQSSGRLQLAHWIVDPKNPLTARVMVNRIWLHHFGRGLVPTPNDFGRQGKAPSNPELLDYLATEFMRSGWSIKAMHRCIMLSRTYRLSSARDAESLEHDPTNEWLSAFPRRRLDAEALRDTLLLLSGNLDASRGGAHPFPPQTEWKFTQHNPFKAVYESNRRSVYLMTQRIQRHPYLAIFDGPDPSASTPQRITSTTPLQALFLLNDPFVHTQAIGIAKRLFAAKKTDAERVELAYLLMIGRTSTPEEAEQSLQFLSKVRPNFGDLPEDQLDDLSWQALVRAMLRLNEFVYID